MFPRHLEPVLRRTATQYPVVSLTGPRQSGKTTLVRATFPDWAYVSLESPAQRRFALDDPEGFLAQFQGPAILDEAQRAPELFSYMQVLVDERRRPGQFILTGSENFLLRQTISQSLAGRCAVLHLLPFALAELDRRPPLVLESLSQGLPPPSPAAWPLLETLFRGGYPRIHDQGLDASEWLANYTQTYLERDVRQMLNVGDLESFERFLGLCAGRAGQLLNLSALAADCGVAHVTARRWLSVLQASFVVHLLPPYHRNFNKRLTKSPKLYFLDCGLLCHLLRIRAPEDLRIHASRGAVFENFVVAELYKNFLHRGLVPPLYFWRDSTGHEVDVIVDLGSQALPAEIKSGETVAADFFAGLDFWRRLAGQPDAPGVVFYGGRSSFRERGTAVCSWAVL